MSDHSPHNGFESTSNTALEMYSLCAYSKCMYHSPPFLILCLLIMRYMDHIDFCQVLYVFFSGWPLCVNVSMFVFSKYLYMIIRCVVFICITECVKNTCVLSVRHWSWCAHIIRMTYCSIIGICFKQYSLVTGCFNQWMVVMVGVSLSLHSISLCVALMLLSLAILLSWNVEI